MQQDTLYGSIREEKELVAQVLLNSSDLLMDVAVHGHVPEVGSLGCLKPAFTRALS